MTPDDGTAATRLGAGRYAELLDEPDGVETTVHQLTTSDDAKVIGVLRVPRGARTVVTVMHPRQDVTHHASVPYLLTQRVRRVDPGLALAQQRPDPAARAGDHRLRRRSRVPARRRLRPRRLPGPLRRRRPSRRSTASRPAVPPGDRLSTTPSGRPVPLADTAMPLPDGCIFMAPHPGQGALLLRGSSTRRSSTSPTRSPWTRTSTRLNPANGFVPAPTQTVATTRSSSPGTARPRPPGSSGSTSSARAWVAGGPVGEPAFKQDGDPADRRRAIAPRMLTVVPHRRGPAQRRPVAGPQRAALRLAVRPAPRPDQLRAGRLRPAGHGRGVALDVVGERHRTPTSRGARPEVTVPTLLLELTGDQASFPGDIAALPRAAGRRRPDRRLGRRHPLRRPDHEGRADRHRAGGRRHAAVAGRSRFSPSMTCSR